MQDGKFRYEGQTIKVPKGQGSRVKQLLLKEGVDAPVIESKEYTYEQVRNLTSSGWGSFRFDATNPTIIGGALFMAVVVGTCVYLYEVVNKPQKPWWKKALKAGDSQQEHFCWLRRWWLVLVNSSDFDFWAFPRLIQKTAD